MNNTRWTPEQVQTLMERKAQMQDKARAKLLTKAIDRIPPVTAKQQTQALGRLPQGTMNKTEAAYAKRLEALKQTGEVIWWAFEPINLRLAANTFYKVDFLVMLKGGALEAHEVKGFWTDDARVKIKVAADKFPFQFYAVQFKKGEWIFEKF